LQVRFFRTGLGLGLAHLMWTWTWTWTWLLPDLLQVWYYIHVPQSLFHNIMLYNRQTSKTEGKKIHTQCSPNWQHIYTGQ